MISFDTTDLKQWQNLLKHAPQYIQAASASVLNNAGFHLRELQQLELGRKMIIRNAGMLKRFLTVQKTGNNTPISKQEVHVGSTTTKNFTGWSESEEGGQSDRAKLILLMARGGDPHKIVPKANRIVNAAAVVHAGMFDLGPTQGNETIGLIMMLARQDYKGLFQMQGKDGHEAVYRIRARGQYRGKRGGRKFKPVIDKIQVLGKHMKDRAYHWNHLATQALLTGSSFADQWKAGLAHAMELAKKAKR